MLTSIHIHNTLHLLHTRQVSYSCPSLRCSMHPRILLCFLADEKAIPRCIYHTARGFWKYLYNVHVCFSATRTKRCHSHKICEEDFVSFRPSLSHLFLLVGPLRNTHQGHTHNDTQHSWYLLQYICTSATRLVWTRHRESHHIHTTTVTIFYQPSLTNGLNNNHNNRHLLRKDIQKEKSETYLKRSLYGYGRIVYITALSLEVKGK